MASSSNTFTAETYPLDQSVECQHVTQNDKQSSMFCKGKIRDFTSKQSALKQPCDLCNIVYPFWKGYADTSLVSSKPSESQIHGQHRASSLYSVHLEEWKTLKKLAFPLTFIAAYNQDILPIKLHSREVGEAYHVLICCFLLQNSTDLKVRVDFEYKQDVKKNEQVNKRNKQGIKEIQDLFDWYRITNPPGSDRAARFPVGKEKVTKVIAAAFRASNDSTPMEHVNHCPPAELFERIREILVADPWSLMTNKPEMSDKLNRKYFWPSYAAKYWLNRYFSLTDQPKLPKMIDVSKLAVIHVRRSAKSDVGRVMNNENLKHVADSIARTNKLAQQANEHPFSHIMLYGDFEYSDGLQLKALVEKAFRPEKLAKKPKKSIRSPAQQSTKDQVKISFISRPWEIRPTDVEGKNEEVDKREQPAKKLKKRARNLDQKPTNVRPRLSFSGLPMGYFSKNREDKAREVDKLWEKFRDFNFDHLPVQIKILAIWTTLCERYHPNMCVIGHRSGFIEGAGLIGIPIFYLNNERRNIGKGNHLPENLL